MSTPVAHGTAIAGLSPRATSALAEAGIETLEDALERARQAPDKLLQVSGFGAASLVKLVAWGSRPAAIVVPDGFFDKSGGTPPSARDSVAAHARELLALATQANGGRLRPTDSDAAWAVARRFHALAEGKE